MDFYYRRHTNCINFSRYEAAKFLTFTHKNLCRIQRIFVHDIFRRLAVEALAPRRSQLFPTEHQRNKSPQHVQWCTFLL